MKSYTYTTHTYTQYFRELYSKVATIQSQSLNSFNYRQIYPTNPFIAKM